MQEALIAVVALSSSAITWMVCKVRYGGAAARRRAEKDARHAAIERHLAEYWHAAYGEMKAERDELRATLERFEASWKRPRGAGGHFVKVDAA